MESKKAPAKIELDTSEAEGKLDKLLKTAYEIKQVLLETEKIADRMMKALD